ncbi:hypothetical protein N665_0100s0015 [Sinapis alba]|nr:hypothetical protein N665_0100s0015 [Sinapis alba]
MKKWGKDVEVIYGAMPGISSKHWIGMTIHLKNRTITLFQCGLLTENKNIDIPQVEELAVLIPALVLKNVGEESTIKYLVPFKVEKSEGIPITNFRFNCGLFVVKMLESHSLKIEDMSKINEDNAQILRRSLSCEIFNQFLDENFGK